MKYFTGFGAEVTAYVEDLIAENDRLKVEIVNLKVANMMKNDVKEVKKMSDSVVPSRPGRTTPSNPVSKDDELKTVKGVPKRPAEELARATGSDPI